MNDCDLPVGVVAEEAVDELVEDGVPLLLPVESAESYNDVGDEV